MTALTHDDLNALADDDLAGPVALSLIEALTPVDGPDAPIFPPTYAGIGYNIDALPDGTLRAAIDSVGSQANRIEPMFRKAAPGRRENPMAALVPQIDITYRVKEDGPNETRSVSILEVGHRLGDAIVRGTALASEAQEAFRTFLKHDDATKIARLAPTSLVFGAWDSRDTQAKLPRIVTARIDALDVARLTRSAQYIPAIDYAAAEVVNPAEKEKAEGKAGSELAQRGYVHVPSTEQHGGVIARGGVQRTVNINLVALRRLDGENGQAMRRYVLGLALVAATAQQDGFLRSGCQLVPDIRQPAVWSLVRRSGERVEIELTHQIALEYAKEAAGAFGVGGDRSLEFDLAEARKDVKKKA